MLAPPWRVDLQRILSGQGAARAWGFGTPAGRAPGIEYALSDVGDRGSAGRGGGGGPAEGPAPSCTVLNRTLAFLGLLQTPKDPFVVSLLFRFYRPGQVASCAAETLTTSYRLSCRLARVKSVLMNLVPHRTPDGVCKHLAQEPRMCFISQMSGISAPYTTLQRLPQYLPD